MNNITFDLYKKSNRKKVIDMMNALYIKDPEGEKITDDKIEDTLLASLLGTERLCVYVINEIEKIQEDAESKNIHGNQTANKDNKKKSKSKKPKKTAIGYGLVTLTWSNEFGGDILNLQELYIIPEYRSKGIGKSFVNKIVDKFPTAVSMSLETTRKNRRA
ncbi:MAG: GNAT family N-acetyltransferase, partial [Anaerovoracaceae bacterium]